MSLIFITNHNENIYDIVKTETDLKKKSPRYKKNKLRGEKNVAGPSIPGSKRVLKKAQTHATMGVPEEEPPDPHNYLKKRTGKPSYTVEKTKKEDKICRKMNVPHKGETPLVKELLEASKAHQKEVESTKNFIKVNVNIVKEMKPKEPEHKVVVDRVGTTIHPEAQGLEPVHIKKAIFGRTPQYLVRFNKIKEKEYQMRKDASGKQQPKCHYITRDEREQLLNGLKKNWEELQKLYQGLPILTDTIPKIVKKSKLESDLKQLEKDIVLVERHPYIYVYNDEDFS